MESLQISKIIGLSERITMELIQEKHDIPLQTMEDLNLNSRRKISSSNFPGF